MTVLGTKTLALLALLLRIASTDLTAALQEPDP